MFEAKTFSYQDIEFIWFHKQFYILQPKQFYILHPCAKPAQNPGRVNQRICQDQRMQACRVFID